MKLANLLAVLLLFTSFIPGVKKPFYAGRKIVPVSGVTQLYQEVNNPANAGNTLVLQDGIYLLDPLLDTKGTGLIQFQKDMYIIANPGTSVIVNGSKLVPPNLNGSMPFEPKKTGFIRMGNGNNRLSNVTIFGNENPDFISAVDTDLATDQSVDSIDNCTIKFSQTGIDIRIAGSSSKNHRLTAIVFNNTLMTNLIKNGQCIVIQNALNADNASITVNMHDNQCTDNLIGIRIMNQSTVGSHITVNSKNDYFTGNGLGMYIAGGMMLTPPVAPFLTADGNAVQFTGVNTHLYGNSRSYLLLNNMQIEHGDLKLIGGYSEKFENASSSNTVLFDLACPDTKGSPIQLAGYGAYSNWDGGAGVDNTVSVKVCYDAKMVVPTLLPTNRKIILKGESNKAILSHNLCPGLLQNCPLP
jgi:hypothetical protein